MPKLPVISGEEAVRAFQRAGWHVDRRRGSHVVMLKSGSIASLSVPQHSELAPGTLRALVRAAGMTVESSSSCADDALESAGPKCRLRVSRAVCNRRSSFACDRHRSAPPRLLDLVPVKAPDR
jgi:predicted RNA binding protein YcfA (HicA-like mRNA interferase family)